MTDRDRRLPLELERLIEAVLAEANLTFVDGAAEVERELRAHFEDGLASGTSPEALIEKFGDPVVVGQRIARSRPQAARRSRGERGRWWMSPREWWAEARQAVRRLKRAPGFVAIVVLTLGLGVGANTAIFTVLDAVLLEDLPYPEPERLVRVYEGRVENPTQTQFMRAPMVAEYRTWDEVFEGFGAIYTYREVGADLTDGEAPRRVSVMRVSAGYFETLGIAPALGRTFLEEESFGPGEPMSTAAPLVRVAILSHNLWAGQYGGDREILGRTIQLDGVGFEIVGVMPRGFHNPFGGEADVWVPQNIRLGGSNSFGNYYLSAVARLRDGVGVGAARERLAVLARGFAEAEPDAENTVPRIFPLQADVVGATRRTMLWILAVAAGLVLLTACVNVANLLFARGLGQDRNLALRSALGSGRARLIASILTENGLLAAAGGLVGLVLGWAGVGVLLRLSPDALPVIAEPRVGASVFLFALSVTGGALMLFGLAPALRMSRTSPADVLRSGDRAATAGRTARRLGNALVVVQVAAALVLVAGAALLARSFGALVDVPLGLEPAGVLTFEVHLPGGRYPEGEARQAFHETFQERVAALPEVEAVGATSWLPVNGRYHQWEFYWDAENPDGSNPEAWRSTDVRVFAGDYFGAMGIDLLKGVDPTEVDFQADSMVWVNQALVDEYLGDSDPLDQRLWLASSYRRVMGVVEDIPYDERGAVSPKSYVPHAQFAGNRNWALIQTVRARGDLAAVRERIREVLAGIDGQLVLYKPAPLEGVLATVRAQDRFATVLMGSFAALAVVLSLVGLYGVLAGAVARRTREIGIRMALGADRRRVRSMVVRQAAGLTLPGVALGLLGAWLGSRWIAALLFEVGAADPVAYSGAVAVFVGVGLLAGWVPARRATRVDTVDALSAE